MYNIRVLIRGFIILIRGLIRGFIKLIRGFHFFLKFPKLSKFSKYTKISQKYYYYQKHTKTYKNIQKHTKTLITTADGLGDAAKAEPLSAELPSAGASIAFGWSVNYGVIKG